MTNLILHKNEETVKPWEKSILSMDTASNTHMFKAPQFGKGTKKPLLSNFGAFGGKEDSKLNTFLNPMVESFLSFNIENNQTGLGTNANVTAIQQPTNNNIFDQTLFNDDMNNNYPD